MYWLPGGQAADQQEVPRAGGGDQRPVAYRGPFVPFPQERRSNTASETASSARITVLAGVVTWKSQGMMTT